MANENTEENIHGCLHFYRKNGTKATYKIGHEKITIGSSVDCSIRIYGEGDIFCVLQSNQAGVAILVNESRNPKILVDGSQTKMYTILEDGCNIEIGKRKFSYTNPAVRKQDISLTRQLVERKLAESNIKRRSVQDLANKSAVSSISKVVSSAKRRFSTGSRITNKGTPHSTKSFINSNRTSTPQSVSKVRFSQRMTKARHSTLTSLKENERFELSPAEKNVKKSEMKKSGANLKELDLNSSEILTPTKVYSGNLSDASEITTPDNNISAVMITPLNVSKKSAKKLGKAQYPQINIIPATPKSGTYKPLVEDVTPVLNMSRSSQRLSSIRKPAFGQRRSVTFDFSSMEGSEVEEPDSLVEQDDSAKGTKKKRSISPGLISTKRVARNRSYFNSSEIDVELHETDSELLGVDPLSDNSLNVSDIDKSQKSFKQGDLTKEASTVNLSTVSTRSNNSSNFTTGGNEKWDEKHATSHENKHNNSKNTSGTSVQDPFKTPGRKSVRQSTNRKSLLSSSRNMSDKTVDSESFAAEGVNTSETIASETSFKQLKSRKTSVGPSTRSRQFNSSVNMDFDETQNSNVDNLNSSLDEPAEKMNISSTNESQLKLRRQSRNRKFMINSSRISNAKESSRSNFEIPNLTLETSAVDIDETDAKSHVNLSLRRCSEKSIVDLIDQSVVEQIDDSNTSANKSLSKRLSRTRKSSIGIPMDKNSENSDTQEIADKSTISGVENSANMEGSHMDIVDKSVLNIPDLSLNKSKNRKISVGSSSTRSRKLDSPLYVHENLKDSSNSKEHLNVSLDKSMGNPNMSSANDTETQLKSQKKSRGRKSLTYSPMTRDSKETSKSNIESFNDSSEISPVKMNESFRQKSIRQSNGYELTNSTTSMSKSEKFFVDLSDTSSEETDAALASTNRSKSQTLSRHLGSKESTDKSLNELSSNMSPLQLKPIRQSKRGQSFIVSPKDNYLEESGMLTNSSLSKSRRQSRNRKSPLVDKFGGENSLKSHDLDLDVFDKSAKEVNVNVSQMQSKNRKSSANSLMTPNTEETDKSILELSTDSRRSELTSNRSSRSCRSHTNLDSNSDVGDINICDDSLRKELSTSYANTSHIQSKRQSSTYKCLEKTPYNVFNVDTSESKAKLSQRQSRNRKSSVGLPMNGSFEKTNKSSTGELSSYVDESTTKIVAPTINSSHLKSNRRSISRRSLKNHLGDFLKDGEESSDTLDKMNVSLEDLSNLSRLSSSTKSEVEQSSTVTSSNSSQSDYSPEDLAETKNSLNANEIRSRHSKSSANYSLHDSDSDQCNIKPETEFSQNMTQLQSPKNSSIRKNVSVGGNFSSNLNDSKSSRKSRFSKSLSVIKSENQNISLQKSHRKSSVANNVRKFEEMALPETENSSASISSENSKNSKSKLDLSNEKSINNSIEIVILDDSPDFNDEKHDFTFCNIKSVGVSSTPIVSKTFRASLPRNLNASNSSTITRSRSSKLNKSHSTRLSVTTGHSAIAKKSSFDKRRKSLSDLYIRTLKRNMSKFSESTRSQESSNTESSEQNSEISVEISRTSPRKSIKTVTDEQSKNMTDSESQRSLSVSVLQMNSVKSPNLNRSISSESKRTSNSSVDLIMITTDSDTPNRSISINYNKICNPNSSQQISAIRNKTAFKNSTKKSAKNTSINLSGIKRLLKTPRFRNSPKNDLTDISGVGRLMKTPYALKTPKNDLTNVSGVETLLRTPHSAKSPKKDLINVSKVENDLTDISAAEHLLKTPYTTMSPEYNEENKIVSKTPRKDSTRISEVEQLLIETSPRKSTNFRGSFSEYPKSPKTDLTDVSRAETLLKSSQEKSTEKEAMNVKNEKRLSIRSRGVISPKNDLTNISGLKNISAVGTSRRSFNINSSNVDTDTDSTVLESPKRVSITKSPRDDLTLIQGVKKNLRTPREHISPTNDLTNISGVKKLMKTPSVQKSPRNDLTVIQGVKKLLRTPKEQTSPKNDLTNISGIKKLMKTPRVHKSSPKNDITNISGLKKLMKTPRVQKSPKNDLTLIQGVKKLLRTPKELVSPKNDLMNIQGVKKLMRTPKEQKSPKNDLTKIVGVKRLLRTPKIQNSPKNDLTFVMGLKKIFSTPNKFTSPKNDLTDVRGVRNLLRTPKNEARNDTFEVLGIDALFNDSKDSCFDKLIGKKPVRTYKKSPKKASLIQEDNKIEDNHPVIKEHVVEWVEQQAKLKNDSELSKNEPQKRTSEKFLEIPDSIESHQPENIRSTRRQDTKRGNKLSLTEDLGINLDVDEKSTSTPIVNLSARNTRSKKEEQKIDSSNNEKLIRVTRAKKGLLNKEKNDDVSTERDTRDSQVKDEVKNQQVHNNLSVERPTRQARAKKQEDIDVMKNISSGITCNKQPDKANKVTVEKSTETTSSKRAEKEETSVNMEESTRTTRATRKGGNKQVDNPNEDEDKNVTLEIVNKIKQTKTKVRDKETDKNISPRKFTRTNRAKNQRKEVPSVTPKIGPEVEDEKDASLDKNHRITRKQANDDENKDVTPEISNKTRRPKIEIHDKESAKKISPEKRTTRAKKQVKEVSYELSTRQPEVKDKKDEFNASSDEKGRNIRYKNQSTTSMPPEISTQPELEKKVDINSSFDKNGKITRAKKLDPSDKSLKNSSGKVSQEKVENKKIDIDASLEKPGRSTRANKKEKTAEVSYKSPEKITKKTRSKKLEASVLVVSNENSTNKEGDKEDGPLEKTQQQKGKKVIDMVTNSSEKSDIFTPKTTRSRKRTLKQLDLDESLESTKKKTKRYKRRGAT